MAPLAILKYPNGFLKMKAKKVKLNDMKEGIRMLVKNLLETMYLFDGIGLAANQVGCLWKVFVVDVSPEKNSPIVFINPKIEKKSGRKILDVEGCLSFPRLYLKIRRHERVKVRYYDEEFRIKSLDADGLLSRVIQHEFDHLCGIVFVDRLPFFERWKTYLKLRKTWKST